MASPTTQIDNNAPRYIILPATKDWANGYSLKPGKNNVPKKYMEQLSERKVKTVDEEGNVTGERYPGREELARLQEPVVIHTHNGSKVSPLITVYPDGAVAPEEGPQMPATLDGYSEMAAVEIVKRTTDRATLQRWEKGARIRGDA
jgi:hypothetical protein